MLNLDPKLLDQDKIRLERRKRLLLISILPTILLIVLALFFGRTGLYNISLAMEKDSNTFNVSSPLTDFQKVGNIIEPYLPYYNSGYIKLISAKNYDDLTAASDNFRESLKHNPPKNMLCSIYGNLSYAIELQADLKVGSNDYDSSIALFNRAEALLYENACAAKDDKEKGSDEKSENAKHRISDKRRKAIAAANNVEDDGTSDDSKKNQQISEEQLQELKDRQSNSIQDMANQLQYYKIIHGGSGRGGSSGGFYTPKF